MAIARTVSTYLQLKHVTYNVVVHPYSDSSYKASATAHVPARQIAKAVILSDRRGLLMAVIPADSYVSFQGLWKMLGRRLHLISEVELKPVFRDCESGAIPPLGSAYGLDTIVDESLREQTQVYFESGDHRGLIRVNGDEFERLMHDALHGRFARERLTPVFLEG